MQLMCLQPNALRLSQHHVSVTAAHMERIQRLVRVQSDALTTQCRQTGLPMRIAEVCAGLLASVVDDLDAAGKMKRSNFERTKRLERVIAACQEPAASALRCAMAASPINGRAVVSHWDKLCEQHEQGKVAWLLGMDTEPAIRYSRRHGATEVL